MKVHLWLLLLAAILLLALPGALGDEGPGAQLVLAGSYDTFGLAIDVAVAGDYAYVAAGSSGLVVIDVSDPTNPTWVGGYDITDGHGEAGGVAVAGGYAYVVDSSYGLVVVNVSNPANPTEAGRYGTSSGAARDVAVAGGYAFVVDNDGLSVVDVNDPTNPTWVGGYTTYGLAHGVVVAGMGAGNFPAYYAYIADYNGGLVVLDVNDPANPTYVGSYNTNYAHSVAVSDVYAYVADGSSGLVVLDVSDPANPILAGRYSDGYGSSKDVAVAGGYAYVADGDEGLSVVDVSDPLNPTLAVSIRLNFLDYGYAYGVAVTRGYVYVADGGSGLLVLEPDIDGDGVADVRDLFPSDPDEWADTDGDGVGDNGDPMPDNALLNAWWQVGLILLVVIGAVAAASYQYGQYTINLEVSGKLDELRAKIVEFKEKGINTDELEKVLAECKAEMGTVSEE